MALPEKAQDVLDFWFGEFTRKQWFTPDAAVDQRIRARFGDLLARFRRDGVPETWRASAQGRLAAIVVLDQFSRNIHRGTADAFAADGAALALARETLAAGLDRELDATGRMFVYMPFQHAEDRPAQQRSLELFASFDDPEANRSARVHKDVIDRFGRFPHRNAALGRVSTAAEKAYLENEASRSGWTASQR